MHPVAHRCLLRAGLLRCLHHGEGGLGMPCGVLSNKVVCAYTRYRTLTVPRKQAHVERVGRYPTLSVYLR